MSTTPPTPPPSPRRNHDLLWLLTGVVLLAALLVGSGVYVFSRHVLRRVMLVREEMRGRSMRTQAPAGSPELGDSALLGLPIYPGAHPTGRKSAGVSLAIPVPKGMRLVTEEFVTPDPFEMVVDYYRRRLGQAEIQSRGTNEVRFALGADAKRKWVVVRRSGLQTEIALANATEAGGQ